MKVLFSFLFTLWCILPSFGQNNLLQNFDYAPDEPDSVIAARIASIDSDMPLIFNDKVRAFIDMYTLHKRSYTKKIIARKNIYFHIFEEALKRHHMPDDLKYLTIVESGVRPTAKSHAGALGLWQFMPSTGKFYGLNYNYYIDERMDPYQATEAACRYLKVLYKMYNDWELALAAYNCGPGNVRKAIRRSGYKKTFWEIYNYLPRETRGYVPIFMAVNYTFRFHKEHNIHASKIGIPYKHFESKESTLINFDILANRLNVCQEEIAFLNPEIKEKVVPQTGQIYSLRLPIRKKHLFDSLHTEIISAVNVQPVQDPKKVVIKTYYKVRRGDNLGKIAEKHHVGISKLRAWNNIGKRNIIYPGQRLVVYSQSKYTTSHPSTKSNKVITKKTYGNYYTVRRGDAVSTISRRHGISTAQLKKWNGIGSRNIIKTGQKLRVKNPSIVTIKEKQTGNSMYIVKKGDTLWSISKKKDISVSTLKKINQLRSSNLEIGQKLKISI